MKKKEFILFILCLLYVLSFFISAFPPGNVICMGLLAAYSLTMNSFADKLRIIRSRPYLVLMFCFGLWLLISAATSANHHSAGRVTILRLPLVILPLTFGLVQISTVLRNRILLGLAVITTISTLISASYAFYQFRVTGLNFWLYNDSVSFFIGQQPIYTSLFVNISIYIFTWFLLFPDYPVRAKAWMAAAIVILFLLGYVLASRNMMFILYSLTAAFVITQFIRRKKYLEGLIVVMAFGFAAFFITRKFPSTVNRFRELLYTNYDYRNTNRESHYDDTLTAEQWNGANFRLAAWPCGWQLFKEHPLTGVGIGDKRDELMEVYRQKQFHFAIATNKNVHNNYLDILFGSGLTGFVLFFTGWLLLPLLQFIQRRDWLPLLCLCTVAAAMITENYFDRSIGGMLFAFLVLLLCSDREKN